MGLDFGFSHLLEYTDWERGQWHAWFRTQGPSALAVGLGANGDGRINSIGELVRHIFAAETRYAERIRGVPFTDSGAVPADDVEALFAFGHRSRASLRALLAELPAARWDQGQEIQLGKQTRTVTPRKMIVQAVTHEIRHWAQIATLLRIDGRKSGAHDFLVSPVLDPPA